MAVVKVSVRTRVEKERFMKGREFFGISNLEPLPNWFLSFVGSVVLKSCKGNAGSCDPRKMSGEQSAEGTDCVLPTRPGSAFPLRYPSQLSCKKSVNDILTCHASRFPPLHATASFLYAAQRSKSVMISKTGFFAFLKVHRTTIRVSFLLLGLAAVGYSLIAKSETTLTVTIREAESGEATPARIRVTDAAGEPVTRVGDALAVPGESLGIPREAIAVMYGRQDVAEGFARQPDGSFYVDGTFTLRLEPGEYTIQVSKGYEYRRIQDEMVLDNSGSVRKEYRLERWINMPKRGWYSADDHIHLTRSPREDPHIMKWIQSEDIHVGNVLQMGDFWSTFFSQYDFGESGRYREGGHILSPGQEDPRTPEIGHTISLGASEFVRFRSSYYRYDQVFDRVHELGGISGYAHQGMSFHGYRGLSMDVPEQKIDFLELLQFCVEGGPLHVNHYYHFLDLGFPLTATAGSDFPWCGRGPRFGLEEGCSQIGDARFYTRVESDFNFENWLSALKDGHTFVSSGPMLELTIEDSIPGDRLEISSGDSIRVRARAFGTTSGIPLEKLEIIGHGHVLGSVDAVDATTREELELDVNLVPEHGIWIAARCEAGPTQLAHTTPIYISVDGDGFHNPETAGDYLDLTEDYLQEIEGAIENPGNRLDDQISRHEESVRLRLQRVRKTLESLRRQIVESQ